MTDMQTLEPLHFPLQGTQLIEASAGTGKTYTITALYLRLLLGHVEGGSATPLGPVSCVTVSAAASPMPIWPFCWGAATTFSYSS